MEHPRTSLPLPSKNHWTTARGRPLTSHGRRTQRWTVFSSEKNTSLARGSSRKAGACGAGRRLNAIPYSILIESVDTLVTFFMQLADFEMISTTTGSWIRTHRKPHQLQLPVVVEINSKFAKLHDKGEEDVHTLDGTEYTSSLMTSADGSHTSSGHSRLATFMKISKWFRRQWAIGFKRAFGAIESYCPSTSKSSPIFYNFHEGVDGVHTVDGFR